MVMAAHHKIIHPLWIRLCHWVNFIALTIMLLSGWRIYNASPIFSFSFPKQITLGNWLGGALLWHFAFMWLFFLNGLIYLLTNILTGRFMKKFFPLRRQDLINDIMATLKAKLDHGTLATYNTIQKLAYLFIICDLILLVLSGLVLWKSVQFPLLRELLGGYDSARVVHFCAMVALLGFFIIHVTMVALVPRTLIMMIRGR
ncbi:MAG: cytochrome B [Ferrovum sp.]|nr:cytochrome B [Ferrovum sp.]